jgi:ACR3 family arsenite efflux pump ArsB
MKRISAWINATLDREDARAFWLRSALVAVSMLFMWPRMLWVFLGHVARWLRRDCLLEIARTLVWVLAPFFFWVAPLIVWLTERSRSKPCEDDL